MLEEALPFDARLSAALAMIEGALGIKLDEREKARAMRDARTGRPQPRRYRLYRSRRLAVSAHVQRETPLLFWLRVQGRKALERTCLEIVQRLGAAIEPLSDTAGT